MDAIEGIIEWYIQLRDGERTYRVQAQLEVLGEVLYRLMPREDYKRLMV